jgi:Tfp pilus assembly protein PilV
LTRRLENESGYSMVEVLAAIVILTIAIIPMVTMFDTGLRSATTSGNYDRARALANTELETIKGMSFDDARSNYPPGNTHPPCDSGNLDCTVETTYVRLSPFDGSGNANFQTPGVQTDMIRIDITVEWGNGNSYSATGLTAR